MTDSRAVLHLEELGVVGTQSQRKRYAFYASMTLALGAAIGMLGFFVLKRPSVHASGNRFDKAMAKAFAMPPFRLGPSSVMSPPFAAPRLLCGGVRGGGGSVAKSSWARSRGIFLLNRLLLEPSECEVIDGHAASSGTQQLVAHLAADDPRTEHVRTQLKALDGQTIRAGVLDGGATDTARLQWVPSVDGGDPEMRLELGAVSLLRPLADDARPRVDMVLVMPRPLQFARLLPMLSSMGIGTLWITGSRRVEKNFFSSHLLRADRAAELREILVQGLEQSGDTAIPKVVVCRNLANVLREEIGAADAASAGPALRLACHPERLQSDAAEAPQLRVNRIRDVIDSAACAGRRVVLAIGPERGWEEPEELELLVEHGFELVTLGPRTLRTDVACVALLAVTHERLDATMAEAALAVGGS